MKQALAEGQVKMIEMIETRVDIIGTIGIDSRRDNRDSRRDDRDSRRDDRDSRRDSRRSRSETHARL
ncbi:unnamed protein product [Trichogramma brassicae]|uniref:Uncharacterized protein n=1 Tax=Trichogramma brassicae TaxID=86971 RepID=A0A6H5IWV0_9HYME|nr:unnamed protein product [Trichogramma brassicae]